MRIMLALLGAILALSAHADVSDSGSLTIGQGGVIQGTMTVQGNAFSVGGSTFSISGGTVQVGGLLKVSALGIQWNDGKVSTTSAIGGSGSVVIQSTTVFMDTGQALGTSTWPSCFTNSTAILNGVTSQCLWMFASGSWLLDSAGYNYGLALVVNGNLVPGTDSSKRSRGQVWEQPGSGGYVWPFTISEFVCGMWPSTTTVSVCLTGSAENSATLAPTSGSHSARKPTLTLVEVK